MASIHRHLSSLFESAEVVWYMPVAYQSAKLRQLVLARLFTPNTSHLRLMTPKQFMDCATVKDHTPNQLSAIGIKSKACSNLSRKS